MKQIRVLLILCAVVLIVLVAESNAGAGIGCEWGGCVQIKSNKCNTGVTGGSGRTKHHKTKSCGFLGIGGRDYCCDPQCTHEQCGKKCEDLNKISYTDEVGRVDCIVDVPGFGKFQSWQEYCCP